MKSKKFNDYIIYEDGTIKSLLTGKLITKRIGPKGYYQVNLCINKKCKTFMLHRLIASLFIDNPNNLPCINHRDGNKLNNVLSNLEWITHKGNTQHAFAMGLIHSAKGKGTLNGKFTEDDVRVIRLLGEQGVSQYKIADMYKVTRCAIQQIINRKTYNWVK